MGRERMIFLKAAVLAAVLCFPTFAFAQEASGFRAFIWGVTKADVRAYEKAQFWQEEEDTLLYFEDADDIRRVIEFDFRGGRLWRGQYDFRDLMAPNPKMILARFYDEEQALVKTYGQPSSRRTIWQDAYYRPYPDYWGRALYTRDLKFVTTWRAGNTLVILQCYFDGVAYRLFYTAQRMSGDEEERTRSILNLPGNGEETLPKARP